MNFRGRARHGARRTSAVVAAAAGALIVAAMALTVSAQSRDPATEAQKIFTSVMSPYCPGLLLADCPSPAAFELRADIRRRLDAGESASDIERDLYRQFGDAIRAVPSPRGWGALLWIAPAIVLALTLAALLWFLGHSRSEGEPVAHSDDELDPARAERLRQELEKVS
jgi:cytochrome c-type biogenesis protein CcmH